MADPSPPLAEAVVIAGHFGFAAAVKARETAVPLWALMLACQLLDVLFAPLLGTGLEGLTPIDAAKPGAYGAVIIHADYTHSLVGALVLAAVFGALLAIRYGKRSGVVLALVVFSHWVLDLLMHRGDMPFLPGDAGGLPRVGFGLWQWPAASALVELALVLVGAFLYWRAAVRTATPHGSRVVRRAHLLAAALLASGLLTLGLNVAGL